TIGSDMVVLCVTVPRAELICYWRQNSFDASRKTCSRLRPTSFRRRGSRASSRSALRSALRAHHFAKVHTDARTIECILPRVLCTTDGPILGTDPATVWVGIWRYSVLRHRPR